MIGNKWISNDTDAFCTAAKLEACPKRPKPVTSVAPCAHQQGSHAVQTHHSSLGFLHSTNCCVNINQGTGLLPFLRVSQPECKICCDLTAEGFGQNKNVIQLQTISSNEVLLC